ncbi:MAG: M14 family zinc carboxypeptidase [Hellea sp.]
MHLIKAISFSASFLLLASCTSVPDSHVSKAQLPAAKTSALCENEAAEIRADHIAAKVDQCDVNTKSSFTLTIRPEAKTDPQGVAINNSAWYGFRVDPKTTADIRIRLNYENGKHRYNPKISYDSVNWEVIPSRNVTKKSADKVDIRLQTDGRPFFVSAQEIFSAAAHDKWTAKMAKIPFVTQSVIGNSRDGYPLQMLEVKTDAAMEKPYVVWVGRQHPPEVTGALALIPFSETVLGDSPLAKRFREHFNVLIIPMMNPDGVKAGHWRFSKGLMDLNRDWGPFSQPETQAVKNAFKRFETQHDKIAFFLDFHSTQRNLLYTQADSEPTSPPFFARDWLKNVDDRLDDKVYTFTREARHNSGKPISKNYMYDTYGISSITYEVGDETDRTAIDLSAKVFAEEMMALLLKHETGQ